MTNNRWSVEKLVSYLQLKLDSDSLIQNISVVGEISNFNHHHTNHLYFTLKDDKSRISCVMFASYANKVDFKLENGLKVEVRANVSLFKATGNLQLYVQKISEFGIGDLAAQYEKLKNKLLKEGLFDNKYKKPIVKYPKSIAIVSGANTAALADILATLKKRWPIANVSVYNALVQGKNAHLDIIEKLKFADDNNHDMIVLARGGGSIEDLWPFNEEALARFIFTLKTFIVVGVGHETDNTIAEYVADLRASTPTGTILQTTPDINEVLTLINNLKLRLLDNIQNTINTNKLLVDYYQSNAMFKNPHKFNDNIKNKLNLLKKDFESKAQKLIIENRNLTFNLKTSLITNLNNYHNNVKLNYLHQIKMLESYSPLNILKRGYSIILKDDLNINSIIDLDINDIVDIKMSDGQIKALIKEKRANDE